MTSVKFKFETWKSYVNKIGEMLLNDDYLISKNFREKDEANYEKFKQIYETILSNIEQMKDLLLLLLEKLVLENQLF